MVLIPTSGSGPPSERAKTYAELNNLISACTLYNQEYHQWPIFSTTPSGPIYILHLANSPRFIPIMTGNLTNHPELAKYNPGSIPFVSFSENDLNKNVRIVDPFGNDDLVLVMDTTGKGVIAHFTVTLTSASGNTLTLSQVTPIHSSIVALSPGRGFSDNDITTTWSR